MRGPIGGGSFPNRPQHSSSGSRRADEDARYAMHKDDFLLYFTAALGVLLPGLVFLLYSKVHSWYVRKGFSFLGNWLSFDDDDDSGIIKTATFKQKEETEPDTSANEQSINVQSQETSENEHVIAIFYATETGTAKRLAYELARHLSASFIVYVADLSTVDVVDFVELNVYACLYIVSTWCDGAISEACADFAEWLEEGHEPLNTHRFAMFGLGNTIYGEECFNKAARDMHSALIASGARPITPLALGDESKSETIDQQFTAWLRNVLTMLSQPHERLDKLADQMYAKCQQQQSEKVINSIRSLSPKTVRRRVVKQDDDANELSS